MVVWKVTYRTSEPQIRYQPLANQTVTHVSALGIRHIFSRALTGVTLKLWLAKNYVTSSTNQSSYFLALVSLLMTPSLLWVLLVRCAPWTSGIQFVVQCFVHGFVIPRKLFSSPKGREFEHKIQKPHPDLIPPSHPLRPNIDTCITNPTGASIYIRKDSLSPKVRWHKVSRGISFLWLWRSPSCRVALSSFVSINKRL